MYSSLTVKFVAVHSSKTSSRYPLLIYFRMHCVQNGMDIAYRCYYNVYVTAYIITCYTPNEHSTTFHTKGAFQPLLKAELAIPISSICMHKSEHSRKHPVIWVVKLLYKYLSLPSTSSILYMATFFFFVFREISLQSCFYSQTVAWRQHKS
jgi:hypothetical protein